MPRMRGFEVTLVIQAPDEQLDARWVMETLGIVSGAALKPVEVARGEEGVRDAIAFGFGNGRDLMEPDEIQQWHQPEFRVATEWLRKRSPAQFVRLTGKGVETGVVVLNYWGMIPSDLLREILRLGLSLSVMHVPDVGSKLAGI